MEDAGWPSVSVVVPSTGRPQLLEAVAGVRSQDYPGAVETVVVLDGEEDHGVAGRLRATGASVLRTLRRAGAGAARNLGSGAASGRLVAYLDDDDLWVPGKLTAQVGLLRDLAASGGAAAPVVATSRVRFRPAGATSLSRAVPDRLPVPGSRVEDYLFRRRRPSLGRALVQTSTLLLPRDLALAVPWDEDLPRHQDWDWVTRAQDEAGARFVMHPEPLVVCATGSAGSISAAADWSSSVAWAERRGGGWSPATRADFLAGQSLRYALQARSAPGVRAVLGAVARTRRVPSWQATAVGLGGLLTRRAFEAVALSTGRAR